MSSPDKLGQGRGIWLPNTHYYTSESFKETVTSIKLLDADTLESSTIIDNLPIKITVYSASPDGKWLNIGIKNNEKQLCRSLQGRV